MSQNLYSTTEQVVGTWIDGKSIYQRTLTGTSSTSNAKVIEGISFNMDTLVGVEGIISSTDSQLWPLPFNNSDAKKANVFVDATSATKNISLIVGSFMNNQPFTLTLRYTKTS